MTDELSRRHAGGISPRSGGLFDRLEIPEVMRFPVYHDAGIVTAPVPAEGHTFDIEVVDPIVQEVSVDVVDPLNGVGPMDHEPREAVGSPKMTGQSDDPTSMAAGTGPRSRWFPREFAIPLPMTPVADEMRTGSFTPSEYSGVGIIIQALADEVDIGQFVHGHHGLRQGPWPGLSPGYHPWRRSVSNMAYAHG